MKISDLSKQSGVSVATIKFYLRERLLPPGTPTARNQAEYDDRHVRRIRLIRTLTSIGGLGLSSVRDLLAAVDDEQVTLPGVYQVLNRTLFAEDRESSAVDQLGNAPKDVDTFVEQLGWHPDPVSPGRDALAHILAALRGLGCDLDVDFFTPFARSAEQLVVAELDLLPAQDERGEKAVAIVRSVMFEAAFAALRRLAHEHHVTLRGLEPERGA